MSGGHIYTFKDCLLKSRYRIGTFLVAKIQMFFFIIVFFSGGGGRGVDVGVGVCVGYS